MQFFNVLFLLIAIIALINYLSISHKSKQLVQDPLVNAFLIAHLVMLFSSLYMILTNEPNVLLHALFLFVVFSFCYGIGKNLSDKRNEIS